MKVKAKRGTNFPPVKVTITLEGQDEYDAFYNLFNYVPICRYLETRGIDHSAVREALHSSGSGWPVAGITSLEAALKLNAIKSKMRSE